MDCAICLAEPDNPQTVPCCMNIFCGDCLKTWTQMRSCCPLCISPLGKCQTNNLLNHNDTEFDNGSLVLDTQLTAIITKATYLRKLYNSKSSNQNNCKAQIRRSSLAYAGEELASIDEFLQIAEVAVNENDRVTATGTMQRITEMLTEVQLLLNGEQTICFQDFDYSSEEEDQDYDYEEEMYQRNEKQKTKNWKANNKKKERVI